MNLDRTFARDIKKQANGDGSLEAKVTFKKQVEKTARALSTTKAAEVFNDCLKNYGQVTLSVKVKQDCRRKWAHAKKLRQLHRNNTSNGSSTNLRRSKRESL